MNRRAFTLVELLVIIAIIGMMVSVAVLSIRAGQSAARVKGASRAVFSTIRQARSIAMVTRQPSIITFSTKKVGDEVVSKAEITSAKLLTNKSLMTSAGRPPRSIDGYQSLSPEQDEKPVETRQAFVVSNRDDGKARTSSESESGQGEESAWFQPMDEELMQGVCIHVVMEGEESEDSSGEVDEAKRSMISTFSNIDVLLGLYTKYRQEKSDREEAEQAAQGRPAVEAEVLEEERHIEWQSNGRAEPHAVYIYSEGDKWDEGWCIKVDMYGTTKVVSDEEDD